MSLVTTQIKIVASPAIVRAKFLDFNKLPYKPDSFIQSIASANNKAPTELVKGDVLNCVVGGGSMKFRPVVVENSEESFRWLGSIPYVFSGEHRFIFERADARVGKDATLFIHEEGFAGVLGWVMGENWLASWLGQHEACKRNFAAYSRDFKAHVEGQ